MWPLIKSFFFDQAVARAFWRTVVAVAGTMAAAGQLPLDDEWRWVGYVAVALAAISTGKPVKQQVSDLTNGKPK